MSVPKNKKELEHFGDIVSYLLKFVRNFSNIIYPLFYAKKNVFQWTPAYDNSFCRIMEYFSDDILLRFPDYSKQLFIDWDASNFGIGGILYQSDGPVSIFNCSLQNAKLDYSATDREFLAMVESIKKFHPYVFGRRYTVFSYHQSSWLHVDVCSRQFASC